MYPSASPLQCPLPATRRGANGSLPGHSVQGHLETFLEATRCSESGSGIPRFVERVFRKFLECGIHAYGFVRVRCRDCGDSLAVAFSCKGRAFCSSCGTRRMSSLAANLVDRVIPRVPVRHWVFSLPFDLRPLVAYRPAALRLVLNTYLNTVFDWIRGRTRLSQSATVRGAAVTLAQRAGGAINLNPHFHSVIADGVFTEGPEGRPRFVKMRHPGKEEIRELEVRLAFRVLSALQTAKYLDRDGTILHEEDDARPDAHAAILGASLTNHVALGDRTGARVEREIGLAAGSRTPRNLQALGFSLFVGELISPSRRGSLDRNG